MIFPFRQNIVNQCSYSCFHLCITTHYLGVYRSSYICKSLIICFYLPPRISYPLYRDPMYLTQVHMSILEDVPIHVKTTPPTSCHHMHHVCFYIFVYGTLAVLWPKLLGHSRQCVEATIVPIYVYPITRVASEVLASRGREETRPVHIDQGIVADPIH